MNYSIASWNVAGLRAILKKEIFHEFIDNKDYDIICFQETKCKESEAILTDKIKEKYPYMYWRSCDGSTQRKGLNGVSIWSKIKPYVVIEEYEFDNEGRLIILEYNKFILINVYTPNSQKLHNERYYFREKWNNLIIDLLIKLNKINKPYIFCGDFNVANEFIDINNPKTKINKVAGFFDNERNDFKKLLNTCNLIDTFRYFNKDNQKSTYWSHFLKQERSNTNGWRIDYFLCSNSIIKNIKNSDMLMDIYGSDHCPLYIELCI